MQCLTGVVGVSCHMRHDPRVTGYMTKAITLEGHPNTTQPGPYTWTSHLRSDPPQPQDGNWKTP